MNKDRKDAMEVIQFTGDAASQLRDLPIGEFIAWPGAYYWQANGARQRAQEKTGQRYNIKREGMFVIVTRTA